MTRVYMTKTFLRFALKARIPEEKMLQAASDAGGGRYDADLGGGVYKQRVARDGGGKSGGFRTIVLFRVGCDVYFVHGFKKSDKANISTQELRALRRLADLILGYSDVERQTAIDAGELIEVMSDGGKQEKG
ncbi:type II toxin-antitoxin system RelE/ParE family toxin [Magnetospirillum fulvum]|uniref:type II toxin-antitoxin system RelE/ParE family toxin n=1 Tax=Magnetospirillum fulvum TaxID=1082 RepID=UPI0009442979|nr:type II toxin-antitoxin system RelE/ParE family toxin [Magnetospirillum fulvum]